jgi:hypothetical protein
MKLVDDQGVRVKVYVRENDELRIGDADLENITYVFFLGRLNSVIIGYRSHLNHEKLKQTLFRVFGGGQRPRQTNERYYWFGVGVRIIMEFNTISEKGNIVFNSKGLLHGFWATDKPVASAAPGL